MDDCCSSKATEMSALASRQRGVLQIVLSINLAMFFIEAGYGWIADSTSLLADSIDMLGDAAVYGFSLYALGRGTRWIASTSLLKGGMMATFGLGVIGEAAHAFITPSLPVAATMGWVGALALVANVTCALLLLRHRNDDINMRSTWLCSRNDVFANLGILAAAGAVSMTQSKMPDLLMGAAIATLVLRSSLQVIRESTALLKQSA